MESKNITGIEDPQQPIYRIFSLQRLKEAILKRELTFVSPSMWDDPYENFLLNCRGILSTGERVSLASLRESWHGQCWTFTKESDAMWRIYSPGKDGIRVRTKISKMADLIWEPSNPFSRLSYFIGKVEYWTRELIEQFLSNTTLMDMTFGGQNDKFARTLLIKRKEFEHENEVRILANNAGSNPRAKGKLFTIQFDPNLLIEEVTTDPRMDGATFSRIEREIRSLGYSGDINHSDLYSVSIDTIRIE